MVLTQPDTSRPQTAPPATRGWWGLLLAGGLLGILGTVWQTTERLSALATTGGESVCDINAVVSCGSVYEHWQSSALGVPNALIGIPVFAVMASAALGALLGSRLSAAFIATLWGLALFMTMFVFWYMEQTAFAIGALCLFCTASMVNIMLAGIGLTRVADAEGALGDGRVGRAVHRLVDTWADLALWFGLAAVVGVMLFLGLAI
jgi:uncharacterized membrane protein